MRWLLLIYTVPRSPSRKRAFIWRELKKAGAIYLRDGVAALPERGTTIAAIERLAATIDEFEGRAIVVTSVTFDAGISDQLLMEATDARQAEYAEIADDLVGFLEHVERERTHRDLTLTELGALEGDLDKLRRWLDQVLARDYVGEGAPERVLMLFGRCDDALAAFRDDVSEGAGNVQ